MSCPVLSCPVCIESVFVISRLRPCRRPLDCWLAGLGVWFLVIVISLLNCVLARWFLDVSFQVTFLQIAMILETDTVTFGAPLGTMGRSRGTWEHKKGDLGVQAWIFIDF